MKITSPNLTIAFKAPLPATQPLEAPGLPRYHKAADTVGFRAVSAGSNFPPGIEYSSA